MYVLEIIKKSLKYPISNWNKLLTVGFIFFLMSFIPSLPLYLNNNHIIGSVGTFVVFFLSFILLGYFLSVVSCTVKGDDDFPKFNSFQNIYDGLKTWVVSIVYFAIPAFLVLIISSLNGVYNEFNIIFTALANSGTLTNPGFSINGSITAVMGNFTKTLPPDLLGNVWTILALTGVIAIILFILFSLFYYVALARMAEHETLYSALNIKSVIDTLGDIGWSKYITWYVLVLIITSFIGLIHSLITTFIPYVGWYIGTFILTPFALLFLFKSIGLIYNEA